MEQSRWKSRVAWASLAALVFVITKTWLGFEIPGWDEIVQLGLGTLVAFGILNNPTNADGF